MGVEFKFLTVEERMALSPEDFGEPELRLFPVLTQEDVDSAPARVFALPNAEKVKSRIIEIARRKGFNLPVEWADAIQAPQIDSPVDAGHVAAHSSEFGSKQDSEQGIAEFELDASTATDTSDGEWVLRTGKIFEAGSYPDKKFEITPEELCEAISSFNPVDLDLEHMPTILDGKLGKLEAVALGGDGWSLIGTVRLPKWLDAQLGEGERKVSATWDRITKKLTKLALVRNPRIKDAALMAAFMVNEYGAEFDGKDSEEVSVMMETLIEKHIAEFQGSTYDGRTVLQAIHDMSARSGAICYSSEKKFNEAQESGFVSEKESKLIQQIHDTALRGGAKCSFVSNGMGSGRDKDDDDDYPKYNQEEKNEMTLQDVKKFLLGLPDDLELEVKEESKTELSADEKATIIEKYDELLAKKEALLRAEIEAQVRAELSQEEKEEEKEEVVEVTAPEAEVEAPAESEAEYSKSERELQLEAELEALRRKDIQREAEQFADAEIRASRAFPSERETLIALFTQASLDDSSSSAKIGFKQGEEDVELTRVDALKALYSVRKPHSLTYEEVEEAHVNVLSTYAEGDADYLGDAEKQAKEYAAKRKAAIKN